jgi:hypothetical protein
MVKALKAPVVRKKLERAGLVFVSDDRTMPDYLAMPIKASGVSIE